MGRDSARLQEEMEIGVIIGTRERMARKEDNSFRKSINFGKVTSTILSDCNRCGHENNLTKSKSVFCSECGALLTNRRYG